MSRDGRRAIFATSLLAAAAALYGAAALNAWFQSASDQNVIDAARALASTGADPAGATLPLFVHVRDALWLQPIPIYLMAAALKLSRGAAAAPALVNAILAAADVALTCIVARRVFGRARPALAAAVILLLAPVHIVYGSAAAPALYPVPFVLLWLIALFPADESEEVTGPRLAAATAALGAGVYTNPEAVWTMTGLAALTLFIAARDEGGRGAAMAAAGFVVPLAPMAPWFLLHPHSYIDTMGRWGIHPANIRNPVEGLFTFFRYDAFARHLGLYWDFFSPRHLFFDAPAAGLGWIGGVLPWPLVVLLPIGIYRSAKASRYESRSAEASRYVLWGFVIAPVAAAVFDEPRSAAAALTLLPFAAMLGAGGLELLLDRRARSAIASERPQTRELR